MIGCNIDVMRQYVCSVVNPININNFAAPFNCMIIDLTTDTIMDVFVILMWSANTPVAIGLVRLFKFAVLILQIPIQANSDTKQKP